MDVKSASPMSRVKSAARALEVIELFDRIKRPASLQEIAQAMGWPMSSTSVLIATLCDMGFLNRHADSHKFAPTMRLPLLGGWIRAGGADGHALAALVTEARRATGCSAVLSTRHGARVQYIYVQLAQAREYVSRNPSSGTLRPICRSAAGIAMLTRESDEQVALLSRTSGALEGKPVPLGPLLQRIEEARRLGYAWQADSNLRGVGDIAVLLNEPDGFGKPLVLSIGAASSLVRDDHERIGMTLRRLADGFSASRM